MTNPNLRAGGWWVPVKKHYIANTKKAGFISNLAQQFDSWTDELLLDLEGRKGKQEATKYSARQSIAEKAKRIKPKRYKEAYIPYEERYIPRTLKSRIKKIDKDPLNMTWDELQQERREYGEKTGSWKEWTDMQGKWGKKKKKKKKKKKSQ